jgi:cation:H+ antiporter
VTTEETGGSEEHRRRPGKQRLSFGLAVAVTVPGLVMRLTGAHGNPAVEAVLFGLAIVGAAFLLSWAAEVAQLDVSRGLAIAVLAFIAVLPEYAVDLVFAWKGGNAVEQFGPSCQAPGASGESSCSLALANMTGANRLLIGIGWSLVVFIAWSQWRRRGDRNDSIDLERPHTVELSFLTVASLYSLTLPLKRTITLIDAALLIALFVAYTVRVSKAPAEEPHLVGPAAYVAEFSRRGRRSAVLAMFIFSAFVILACAESFAEALVETGKEAGVSEFLLVQWLAPLASETPELLVAGLYAWRLNTNAGLGTLVSSKVNQWTLLVGSLPLVFAVASGSLEGLPIIARQREELLLTAAQSVFAVAVLANLSISVKEAATLFGLFWAQFVIGAVVPESAHGAELIIVSAVYLVLAVGIVVRRGRSVVTLLRDGFRKPYSELASQG